MWTLFALFALQEETFVVLPQTNLFWAASPTLLLSNYSGCTGVLQGVFKVLEPFVFAICSKSLGAQKKYYCQIKAEILKFMWVCGKSQFE
jgi:hypothetical protein